MFNHIFSKSHIKRINKKLIKLGNYQNKGNYYLNVKLIFLIFIFFYNIVLSVYGLLISPIITIIMYFVYDYICLDLPIKRRTYKLEKESITFFKVVYFAYLSNKNLKMSLMIATKNMDSELSKEFNKVFEETNYGKNLYDALKDLERRIPSAKLKIIISNINEAIHIGNDVTELLNNQINYLEECNYLEEEKKYAKLPLKLCFAVLLLIIPTVIILIRL